MRNTTLPAFKQQVFKETDYAAFEFIVGNRSVNHAKKLMESLSKLNLSKQYPITCYEKKNKYFILDGQGRYMACRMTDQPVFFVIIPEPIDIQKYIRTVNKYSTSWQLSDYIHQGVVTGNKNYINLNKLFITYPALDKKYLLTTVVGSTLSTLKDGDLKFSKPLSTDITTKLQMANSICEAIASAYKTSTTTNKRTGHKELITKSVMLTLYEINAVPANIEFLKASAIKAVNVTVDISSDVFATKLRTKLI